MFKKMVLLIRNVSLLIFIHKKNMTEKHLTDVRYQKFYSKKSHFKHG